METPTEAPVEATFDSDPFLEALFGEPEPPRMPDANAVTIGTSQAPVLIAEPPPTPTPAVEAVVEPAPAPAPTVELPPLVPTPWTGQRLAPGTYIRRTELHTNGMPRLSQYIVDHHSDTHLIIYDTDYNHQYRISLFDPLNLSGMFEVMPNLWTYDHAAMPRRLIVVNRYVGHQPGLVFTHTNGAYFTVDLERSVSISTPSEILSAQAAMAPIGDNGELVDPRIRPLIYRNMNPTLREQITRYPQAELTRGLIRQQFRRPPPATATTSEAILAWIDAMPLALAITSSTAPASAIATPVPPAPRAREATMRIEVEITERRSGTASFSYDTTYRGTLQIPLSVIAQGEEAVEEWIDDHYGNLPETDSDYDYDNHDTSDTRRLRNEDELDIEELLERYEEEHGETDDTD